MSVGCLKVLPENPAQLQSMLKDLVPGLLVAAGQNALAKEQPSSVIIPMSSVPLIHSVPQIETPSILIVNNLTSVIGLKIFVGTTGYVVQLDANGTSKLNLQKLCGGENKVYIFGNDGYIYNKTVNLECNKNNSINFGDGSWQYSIMNPLVIRTLVATKDAESAKAKAVAAAEKAEAAAAEATAAVTRKAIVAAAATADTAASNATSAATVALEAAKNAQSSSVEALEAAKTNESIAQTNFAVDISGLVVKAADYAKSAEMAAAKAVAAKNKAASEAAADDATISTKIAAKAIAQVEVAKAAADTAKAEARAAKEEAARANAEAKAARDAVAFATADAARAAADAAKAVADVKTSVEEATSAKMQNLGTVGIVIGSGVLVYGIVQSFMVTNSIDKNEFSEAKGHVSSRDTAYILGLSALLAGVSIKIFF